MVILILIMSMGNSFYIGCRVQIHEETFGRSGCRRIVPGEMLVADPRGRALMIGTYG